MRIAQAQREQIRAALVAAGLGLFRCRGFASTTVEAIASKAGVAKGTFYNYFSTKEDLALAALAPMLRDARATLDRLPPPADLHQRLDQLLGLLGTWSSDSPDLVWVWATELPRRGIMQPGSALFHEMLTSLFAAAQAAGQARPAPGAEQLAIGLEGVLLSQVAHWYHAGARGDLAAGLRQAADIYLTGAAAGTRQEGERGQGHGQGHAQGQGHALAQEQAQAQAHAEHSQGHAQWPGQEPARDPAGD